MAAEGHASGSLFNSSSITKILINHQSTGKKKSVDATHHLSTNGALQRVGHKAAQEVHLREKLCCHSHFQGRLWDATGNGKISSYTVHNKVIWIGMDVLNSLFLLFYFDIKIGVMVLVDKNLSRPSVSENISQLAALHSSCAFTTLLQLRSQDDGLFGCLGWDNLDLKITVTQNENQIQVVLLLENLSTGFSPSSLLENEKKGKRIMNNVIQNINLSKEVEEKKTAFSSTVINPLLSLMFKSHVNFASGNAVKHSGLLRNRNEDTVGMDGNRSEESWEAEFSLLLSGLFCSQGHPPQAALGWDRLIISFGSHCPVNQELVR